MRLRHGGLGPFADILVVRDPRDVRELLPKGRQRRWFAVRVPADAFTPEAEQSPEASPEQASADQATPTP